MLGEQIGEESGKVTGRRVLANPGGGPKMETSFEASGKLLGVSFHENGTYWSALRPDGTLYGEGQGIVMGAGGEAATWVGSGIGVFRSDGGVNFRGAIFYQTAAPAWARLNKVATVFEYDVDAQGGTKSKLWEWK
jgi:hypothetical protein